MKDECSRLLEASTMKSRRGFAVQCLIFFFQAEDGIRDLTVTGVQTCALPISARAEATLGVRDAKVVGDTELRVRGEAEKLGPAIPRGFLSVLAVPDPPKLNPDQRDRKSTRLNSSHSQISYAVFCLKQKKHTPTGSSRAILCPPPPSPRPAVTPAALFPSLRGTTTRVVILCSAHTLPPPLRPATHTT